MAKRAGTRMQALVTVAGTVAFVGACVSQSSTSRIGARRRLNPMGRLSVVCTEPISTSISPSGSIVIPLRRLYNSSKHAHYTYGVVVSNTSTVAYPDRRLDYHQI
jgi:hypothetical protein